jgi:hypothetical protein
LCFDKSLEGNDKSLEGNGGPSGGVPHYLQSSAQVGIAAQEQGKAKTALQGVGIECGQGQYKDRSPNAPPLWVPKPGWGGGGRP